MMNRGKCFLDFKHSDKLKNVGGKRPNWWVNWLILICLVLKATVVKVEELHPRWQKTTIIMSNSSSNKLKTTIITRLTILIRVLFNKIKSTVIIKEYLFQMQMLSCILAINLNLNTTTITIMLLKCNIPITLKSWVPSCFMESTSMNKWCARDHQHILNNQHLGPLVTTMTTIVKTKKLRVRVKATWHPKKKIKIILTMNNNKLRGMNSSIRKRHLLDSNNFTVTISSNNITRIIPRHSLYKK